VSEEFSVGVKILLERMDTNPEEFIAPMDAMRGARWGNTMTSIVGRKLGEPIRGDGNFLTDAEIDALYAKYMVIRRKAFDDHILREVLGADEELSSSKPKTILTTQEITNQSLQILQKELLRQNTFYAGTGVQTASIK
jgi:hypothetical protein